MIIMHNRYKAWVGILASIVLGVTFVVAGISKVFTLEGGIELPEILLVMLMGAELLLGILLVSGILVRMASLFSLAPIAGFIASNIEMIIRGKEECLSCFGAMGKLSVTQALYIDGIMVVLAVVIVMWYPGSSFNIRPWYWGKSIERR